MPPPPPRARPTLNFAARAKSFNIERRLFWHSSCDPSSRSATIVDSWRSCSNETSRLFFAHARRALEQASRRAEGARAREIRSSTTAAATRALLSNEQPSANGAQKNAQPPTFNKPHFLVRTRADGETPAYWRLVTRRARKTMVTTRLIIDTHARARAHAPRGRANLDDDGAHPKLRRARLASQASELLRRATGNNTSARSISIAVAAAAAVEDIEGDSRRNRAAIMSGRRAAAATRRARERRSARDNRVVRPDWPRAQITCVVRRHTRYKASSSLSLPREIRLYAALLRRRACFCGCGAAS